MSERVTIAALQRTVAEQEAELLRLQALLASCDERLDELGCGVCAVPPRASVDAVPDAVGEAMTTMRRALARAHVERRALAERVREAIAQRIEGLPDDAASWQGVADNVVRALALDALLEER